MPLNNTPFPLNNTDTIHQFEALFNFATIGIIVTNNEGNIINFNNYAEKQFGFTKDEIIGHTVDLLLPTSTHKRHAKYREQYYHDPEPRIMGHGRDLFAQKKDGTTFPVEVSLSHYMVKHETFVIAFVIDITVRKQHEVMELEQRNELQTITAEIKSMNTELEQKVEDRTKMLREALFELEKSKQELNLAYENEKELNELKSGFVTVASHEFRTPLTTILSSAYLLEKYNQPEPDQKIEKHIGRIKMAVEGMKNILEDFLSLGKIEEGLMHANIQCVSAGDLDHIFSDLIQELEGLLKNGQKLEYNNQINQDVWLDKSLIKNILINLVSNAIKFTQQNGIIQISSTFEKYSIIICVEDKGIGISDEDQKHLFERFFRGKNANHIQGTGLGLHIVGKYVELLNGRISIASKLNEGTTVTLLIPQKTEGETS